MQFISRLMDYYLTADNKKINILGATSDTDRAAIYGFESVQSSNVFILHPHNLISPTEEVYDHSVIKNIINIALKEL